ncbi:MAG: 4Fe-4S dicluster domain-containing protein [Dehalococcoidales bacterium]|nr:4Fe-4S dicluster domain-containing protein [Dehalococcoidales bacterium]
MKTDENTLTEQKTFFIRAEFCTGCGLCQLACSMVKERQPNPARARITVKRLVMDGLMIPYICLNCKNPVCIEACRRKAISKDPETGWVTIDKEKCNNCKLCVAACPFSAIVVTPEDEVLLCDVCGGSPKCVEMCPTGALRFATRSEGVAGSTDTAAVNVFKSQD